MLLSPRCDVRLLFLRTEVWVQGEAAPTRLFFAVLAPTLAAGYPSLLVRDCQQLAVTERFTDKLLASRRNAVVIRERRASDHALLCLQAFVCAEGENEVSVAANS